MVPRILSVCGLALALCGCGSEAPKPAPVKQAEAAPPTDDTRYLPKSGFVDSKVVAKELMSQPFMPGGTIGHYKLGAKEYDIFLAHGTTPVDVATKLIDWKKAMQEPKFLPSFGAYFGAIDKRPYFVFTKGAWIIGIVGLGEKEADGPARDVAARL